MAGREREREWGGELPEELGEELREEQQQLAQSGEEARKHALIH